MGLRCLHTSIFIETPFLEGLPTKAKEDPSPHETRLSAAEHQPSISIIIIIIIIIINSLCGLDGLSSSVGEVNSDPVQTSKMKVSINGFKPLTIFAKALS